MWMLFHRYHRYEVFLYSGQLWYELARRALMQTCKENFSSENSTFCLLIFDKPWWQMTNETDTYIAPQISQEFMYRTSLGMCFFSWMFNRNFFSKTWSHCWHLCSITVLLLCVARWCFFKFFSSKKDLSHILQLKISSNVYLDNLN